MTIKEFIIQLLEEKYGEKGYEVSKIEETYEYIKRRLDYIFKNDAMSERNEPQEYENTDSSEISLYVSPYDFLRSCNRYDFDEQANLRQFADKVSMLLKLYYFVLERFYLYQEKHRKPQFDLINNLFESISCGKISYRKWGNEVDKIYNEIKNDPNSVIEIKTESGLVKKVPIIESFEVDFSNIKTGFNLSFTNNRGIFKNASQSRAYEHLKQNFITVITACWFVLTNKDNLAMELSEPEQEFWRYLYKDFLKPDLLENGKTKEAPEIHSIRAGHWEAIDISIRKEIWGYIKKMTEHSIEEDSSENDFTEDKSKTAPVLQEEYNFAYAAKHGMIDMELYDALKNIHELYNDLSNAQSWPEIMSKEDFTAVKKDVFQKIQTGSLQLIGAFYSAKNTISEIEAKTEAQKNGDILADVDCIANRYIQALSSEELNDQLETLKMKLMNPKLYRIRENITDLYWEITDSQSWGHLIKAEDLVKLDRKTKRFKNFYDEITKDVEKSIDYSSIIEQQSSPNKE